MLMFTKHRKKVAVTKQEMYLRVENVKEW